ncbi:uncharacterized protein UV8b_03813 [Ustilaginoidea virens]|uniref:Major facilitator superfamily (MFS) profile domain-containing protein n=1 Tax=Ustilaginoidea virens TaxID=1159556 RepID=A0A8E5HQD9_USTVR|nr:uncharacterized protein UV8b_03813 [Ustilaginoidea virens]QUC19572.1 hypothetical protein UV8b_03813 [Ustilaginoidea virens]
MARAIYFSLDRFLQVFGLMMASLSSRYCQLMLSQGICSSVGVSATSMAAVGSASCWFKKRRGAAFGIFATGSSLGGVLIPLMLSYLSRSVWYGWTIRSVAFILLALLLIANLAMSSRPFPRHLKRTLGTPLSRENISSVARRSCLGAVWSFCSIHLHFQRGGVGGNTRLFGA